MSALHRGTAATTPANIADLSQSGPPGYRPRPRIVEDQLENAGPRPNTCPVLTSQFHWNLNARAVESLSEEELAQVYRLFLFYDSSTVGDTLPSINCRRFLQMLRDGGVLSTSTVSPQAMLGCAEMSDRVTNESGTRLDISAVEKIFAEAVMGKLRTYLDADGQPALTFHLFCGAIMNCALAIHHTHRPQPEIALIKLLEKLLTSVDHYAEERQREPRRHKSLLKHFPREGLSALWCPNEAHGAMPPMPLSMESGDHQSGVADYRHCKPFQQVLASFSRDVVLDSRARERYQQQYSIPPDLAAHFTPDNLNLVVERFKMFDVFDRGTLPRQEILPLLNGLVKKLEIPDMYEVLTLLLTGEHFSRYGSVSPVSSVRSDSAANAEIPLIEVLKAIHACRRSKTALLSSSRNAAARKTTGIPTHKLTPNVNLNGHLDGHSPLKGTAGSHCDDDEGELSDLEGSNGRRVSKEVSLKGPSRRSKASGSIAQSLNLSKQGSGGKGGDRKTLSTKKSSTDVRHKQSVLLKESPPDAAKASKLSRRASRMKSNKAMALDGSGTANVEIESTEDRVIDSDATQDTAETGHHGSHFDEASMDRYTSAAFPGDLGYLSGITRTRSIRLEVGSAPPLVVTVSVKAPASSIAKCDTSNKIANPKVFRVFLLLGGEHDGAICCTVELVFPERRVEETRGMFYLNAPPKVLERSQVLPVQPDSESALLMLKKRIQLHLSEGFVLHPHDQLDRIDGVLSQIRQHNPHYQSPLRVSHPSDAFRDRLLTLVASSPHKIATSDRDRRSLDRAGTRVREGSTSDLLVQLSDSHTNQSLKQKKRVTLRENLAAVQHGALKLQDSSVHIPVETTVNSLDWIHSVNGANRNRAQLLQASASAPTLNASPKPGSLKQPRHHHSHRAQKAYYR